MVNERTSGNGRRIAIGVILATVAIAMVTAAAILLRSERQTAKTFTPQAIDVEKPSPIAPLPAPSPVTTKPPAAAEPPPTPSKPSARAPRENSGATEWSLVAAIYKSYEAADRRALAMRKQWPPSKAHVFPPEGQGEKYMVVVGSGLTREDAEALLAEAKSAGLPDDTYITKLAAVVPK